MKPGFFVALLGMTAAVAYASDGDVAHVGDEAPEFSGVSTQGDAFESANLHGKVLLLDFFATWCGPCMAEMPRIENEIWQKYRPEGLVVVAVGREHSVAELTEFKAKKNFTFTVLADPKRSIYKEYATQFIPRCYLIGKDGRIKYAVTGYEPAEFDGLKAAIAKELAN